MLKDAINGFCMALADSVPGVSGGTVAFIMGFYDKFIGEIDDLVYGNMRQKKKALRYLIKLGIGWIIGMGMAVLILSAMFESHIYIVSSLFIGFIAGAIPLIVREEQESFQKIQEGILPGVIGFLLVVAITWFNGRGDSSSMNLSHFSIFLGIQLFVIGMFAISAMFLPGISGSTLLLIFGAYIPVITAVKGLLSLQFNYLSALIFFGLGVVTGAVSIVRGIKLALENYRPQAVYAILGMMIGSFYAIVRGPATLENAQAPLGLSNFNLLACVIGVGLVLGMQKMKSLSETKKEEKKIVRKRNRGD